MQVSALAARPESFYGFFFFFCSCLVLLLSKVMQFSTEEEAPISSVLCHLGMAGTLLSGKSNAFSPV